MTSMEIELAASFKPACTRERLGDAMPAERHDSTIHGPRRRPLLEEAKKEESRAGKLRRSFFGAAPGVGKTYEMLQDARARLQGRLRYRRRRRRNAWPEGDRGAAGWPRDHPAPAASTIKAVRSRRWILTASWRRSRRSSLVDELAHTNAAGSRHPKRYQDVEELLSNGIDVYTTRQHPAH